MLLTVNIMGREVIAAALAHHKKLSHDAAALLRRLRIPDKPLQEEIQRNKFLTGIFESIAVDSEEEHTVDMGARESVRALQTALVQQVSVMQKADLQLRAKSMTTDSELRISEAQRISDACSAILEIPVLDVTAMATKLAPEKPAPKEKPESEGKGGGHKAGRKGRGK